MSIACKNVLAIDTSGSFCSVAVLNDSGAIASLSSAGSGDHFEQLPLMVGRACADAGISPSDLRAIRIGVGPGSFTGLRIGMSFAKGLAWSLRVPLLGCSSLAGAATAVMSRDSSVGRVVVLADARRDEVFAAAYTRGAPVVEEVAPCIVPVGELAGSTWTQPGTRWATPQRDFIPAGCEVVSEACVAEGLLMVPVNGSRAFSLEEIAVLEPTYLRAVAAKTIEERKQGA